MRLLITGASGQVGGDLVRLAAGSAAVRGVAALSRSDLDLTDAARVRVVVADQAAAARKAGGLVVINAAAWTDVDGAEADEPGAFAINGRAPAVLASACAEQDARLLHLSTDYVFPGDRAEGPPYRPQDEPAPRSAYGRTKLAGEQSVRALHPHGASVVRTAWVYDGLGGRNFVATMARLAAVRDTVDVVDDQRGTPTWSRDLAFALLEHAVSRAPAGVYHVTNAGSATWYDLAREVFSLLGHDPDRVHPTTTAHFPRPAPRPAYSVLDNSAWSDVGLTPLRAWQDALRAAVLG